MSGRAVGLPSPCSSSRLSASQHRYCLRRRCSWYLSQPAGKADAAVQAPRLACSKNVGMRVHMCTSMSTTQLWQSTLQALGTPPSAGALGTSSRSRFTPCALDIAVTAGGRVLPYRLLEARAKQPELPAHSSMAKSTQSPQKDLQAFESKAATRQPACRMARQSFGGRRTCAD